MRGISRNFCTKSRIDKIHENFNATFFGANKTKKLEWLKEIPYEFNPGYIFGICGGLSGLTLLLLNPTNTNDVPLPFPSIHTSNSSIIGLTLIGSTVAGLFGNKMYIIRNNNKNLQKTFNNLIHRPYISTIHCAGFHMVAFYGLIGLSLIFETLYNGEPFGWTLIEQEYKEKAKAKAENNNNNYNKTNANQLNTVMDYYNPRLRGRNKTFSQCDWDQIKNRFGFSMELLAHTMVQTYIPVFAIFAIGSGILMKTNLPYWNILYKRVKLPNNLSQTLPFTQGNNIKMAQSATNSVKDNVKKKMY